VRVLIAEEDVLARRVLETALTEWGHEVISCVDAESAQGLLLGHYPFDCAILDWNLPPSSGLQVCRAVRSREGIATYLLLLCTPGTDQDPLAGLEAGADDYLLKPVEPHHAQARLRIGQQVLTLRQELTTARETIRVKTVQDTLTGLWNREAMIETVDRELARARREGAPLGFVLLDVDDFRLVNDTFGRFAGDGVLRQLAQRLRGALRPYDSLGRYGGDRFLVIVPGCDAQAASALAERLQTAVSSQPIQLDEGAITIALSAGVAATSNLQEPQNTEALLRAVEAALHKTKQPGQHNLVMATKGSCINLST